MRAMPRVSAGSGGCRDSGPAGAPVAGIRGRRNARDVARSHGVTASATAVRPLPPVQRFIARGRFLPVTRLC
ncbi:hypothetical protein [Luteimonas sp. R10]|uniref:hypothetical protein n=1 Tax=Luteimonas sp. R10 TaxID=3108176 RepID=UPI00308C57E8|nr:hypothetical protein U3649_16635 [Luteimonas sp. R10]